MPCRQMERQTCVNNGTSKLLLSFSGCNNGSITKETQYVALMWFSPGWKHVWVKSFWSKKTGLQTTEHGLSKMTDKLVR